MLVDDKRSSLLSQGMSNEKKFCCIGPLQQRQADGWLENDWKHLPKGETIKKDEIFKK
jgi:hypothetical protein